MLDFDLTGKSGRILNHLRASPTDFKIYRRFIQTPRGGTLPVEARLLQCLNGINLSLEPRRQDSGCQREQTYLQPGYLPGVPVTGYFLRSAFSFAKGLEFHLSSESMR